MQTTQSVFSASVWTPKSYQERAIRLLLSQASGGLFLDPGLGKTSICLAAIKILKATGLTTKVLIVAPLRPMYKVWPDEIRKWKDFNHLTYSILHGPEKDLRVLNNTDIHIINPEGLEWLVTSGNIKQYDVLIIDESTKFKNSQTKRFKLLKTFLPVFKRRWILTGTPVPNGLMDLFGQIYILDLGRSLGRYITHYRQDFFYQTGYGGYSWAPKDDAYGRIIDKISPLIIRMSAKEFLEMPELIQVNVPVSLPQEAMKIYSEVENEFFYEWEGGSIVASSAAASGVKCRQIANGAVYDEKGDWHSIHGAKLEALGDLLEEVGTSPVLVLYEFQHDAERIRAHMDCEVLGSGLSPQKFDSLVDRFNAGNVPVLLGHPASMGHGLNLQGSCHHIVWFGIPWNLEHYDQAIARIYRQGQNNDRVFVYHLVGTGTLDERVVEVLLTKDHGQQELLKTLASYRLEHLERA